MEFIIFSHLYLFAFLLMALVFFMVGEFLDKLPLLWNLLSALFLLGYIVFSLLLNADYSEVLIFSVLLIAVCIIIYLVREKRKS